MEGTMARHPIQNLFVRLTFLGKSESAILKNSSLPRMLVCKGEILNFTKHLRERINQNVRNVVEFRASSLSIVLCYANREYPGLWSRIFEWTQLQESFKLSYRCFYCYDSYVNRSRSVTILYNMISTCVDVVSQRRIKLEKLNKWIILV